MEKNIQNIELLVKDIKSLNERKVKEIENFEKEFLNYLNNKIKEFSGQKFAITISGMYEEAPRSIQRDTRPNIHPFEYIYAGILTDACISFETKKMTSSKLIFFENKNIIPIHVDFYEFSFVQNEKHKPCWDLVDFYKEFLNKEIIETLNFKKHDIKTELYFGNEAFEEFQKRHNSLSFDFLSPSPHLG